MTDHPVDLADLMLDRLATELADRVAAKVAEATSRGGDQRTPWLTTAEAIDYTRLAEGTFRKLAASGKIPSHGGRSKLFYRPELDETLLTFRGMVDEDRPLKRVV
jgi:hypothetical protein